MPTALELTRSEWRPYIESAKHRMPLAKPTSFEIKEREQLLERVRKAATILKNQFGAQNVILFGSLAHGAWFSSKSDVDLAVKGLNTELYWEAWGAIEKMISDRVVELVDLETARDSLREEILQYGIEL